MLCWHLLLTFPGLPVKEKPCIDLENNCANWAAAGECTRNAGFMRLHACRKSCGSCNEDAADLAAAQAHIPLAEDIFMTTPRFEGGSCQRDMPTSLRWGADASMGRQIGCFNRRGAEPAGSWERTTLPAAAAAASGPINFYDSTTGKLLFVAPINRTMEAFLQESRRHGWPSFRDEEVVAENLRIIRGTGGELVSVDGVHLGHNLPDSRSRYCINLVSIAGEAPG